MKVSTLKWGAAVKTKMCGIDYGVVGGGETIGGSRDWEPYYKLAKYFLKLLPVITYEGVYVPSEHVALRSQKVSDTWLFIVFGKGFQEKSELGRKERE